MSDGGDGGDNGWHEYQRLVLSELKAHGAKLQCLDEKMTRVRLEVAALKIKSGLWGALAGLLPAIGMMLYMVLR